jgi:antitoxin component YwqK of YwqJK toxin-antitoxin module
MKNKLTPYIEYHYNGNVLVKGQLNSKEQEEGLWEWFYAKGNIRMKIPFKDGKRNGIEEWFYANGNIYMRTPHKEGKRDGIEEWFGEKGNIIRTRVWKEGKLIEETKP